MRHQLALAVLTIGALAAPALAGGGNVQVIVKFKGDADASAVTAKGGKVLGTLGAQDAVVASIAPGRIAALRADPDVSYVEEDGICEALAKGGNPNKPGGGGGGGDPPPPQSTPWGVAKVLPGGATEKGAGVKVAVIDTGIDLDHEDLAANVQGNVTYVTSGKVTDGNDDNGHGSHVAGSIGAVDNAVGVVGVAPEVDLYAVKVLDRRGSGTWSAVAAGVNWCAANGMNVANMSLGASSSNSTLQSACNAASSTVLLIAAAGNSGDGNLGTNEWSYPATYASVVSVGATTSTDSLASFSNTNPDLEVSAPGYQVPSTYKNNGYQTFSGTSMASPHAAGVAALLWGAAETPSVTGVRNALQTSAIDLGAVGPDNGYGYGRVTYSD